MTNPTDPAAVVVPLRLTDAIRAYGDQREKAAVERVVAWLRVEADQYKPDGDMRFKIDMLADAIERGAHKDG